MEQAIQGTGVQVSQIADNRLKVNIPADTGFATAKADLNPTLRPVLDQLAPSLAKNPAALVEVYGHTDSTGSDAINGPLSRQCAQNVSNYLSSRGVAENRITSDGIGSTQPLVANNTAANRAINRRAEIYVRAQTPHQQAPQACTLVFAQGKIWIVLLCRCKNQSGILREIQSLMAEFRFGMGNSVKPFSR